MVRQPVARQAARVHRGGNHRDHGARLPVPRPTPAAAPGGGRQSTEPDSERLTSRGRARLERGRDPRIRRIYLPAVGSGALIQRAIFQVPSGWRRQTSKLRSVEAAGPAASPDRIVQVSRTTARSPETITSLIVSSNRVECSRFGRVEFACSRAYVSSG